jgi:hypothetical protein
MIGASFGRRISGLAMAERNAVVSIMQVKLAVEPGNHRVNFRRAGGKVGWISRTKTLGQIAFKTVMIWSLRAT